MNEKKPLNMKTLHRDSDGISPYMRCPWCGYADVIGEFSPYTHPQGEISSDTGSTQCGQCSASGPTAMFVLAYDQSAPLGEDDQFRDLYLSCLKDTPEGEPEDGK